MSEVEIFKPTLKHVDSIYEIISLFAKDGFILNRKRDDIAERIREFTCARVEGKVVGVSSLRIYYPSLAEIRSVAVDLSYQSRGVGSQLIRTCLEEAGILGVSNVFALTFKKEFFIKLGFKLIDKKQLPSKKIWEDCVNCPLFPNCGEEAVIYPIFS